ncbi:MAG: class I SAM-dependent methyltransferase [Motiliproteus sp.]
MSSKKSRDEIAKAYDSPPWWYDVRGFFILTFAYNSTLGSQMRLFGPNFGEKHIEIACGSGSFLRLLLQWRSWKKLPEVDIVGIDYAEAMLAGAIHTFKDNPRIALHHADAAELPFPDASFDTANIANSIHCFPDVDGALKDIHRVLKPGGILAANVLLYPRTVWPLNRIAQKINDWGIKKGILYTPYDREEVRNKLVAAGFDIKDEEVSGNCYNIVCLKPEV